MRSEVQRHLDLSLQTLKDSLLENNEELLIGMLEQIIKIPVEGLPYKNVLSSIFNETPDLKGYREIAAAIGSLARTASGHEKIDIDNVSVRLNEVELVGEIQEYLINIYHNLGGNSDFYI